MPTSFNAERPTIHYAFLLIYNMGRLNELKLELNNAKTEMNCWYFSSKINLVFMYYYSRDELKHVLVHVIFHVLFQARLTNEISASLSI